MRRDVSLNHPAGEELALLGWPVTGTIPATPTGDNACTRLFGPQLRGDFRLDVTAGSHRPRSLYATVTRLLFPITAFRGDILARIRRAMRLALGSRGTFSRHGRVLSLDGLDEADEGPGAVLTREGGLGTNDAILLATARTELLDLGLGEAAKENELPRRHLARIGHGARPHCREAGEGSRRVTETLRHGRATDEAHLAKHGAHGRATLRIRAKPPEHGARHRPRGLGLG